jgi:hypothetical protein
LLSDSITIVKFGGLSMRYLRKLNNVNPAKGKYLSISIPTELCDIFGTDTAIIEPLPDGKGITVIPARVEPIV